MLRHWSQFVPNMSTDIRGHEALHHHHFRTQELCERRGERPGLPSLIVRTVSVDAKQHLKKPSSSGLVYVNRDRSALKTASSSSMLVQLVSNEVTLGAQLRKEENLILS